MQRARNRRDKDGTHADVEGAAGAFGGMKEEP